MPDTYNSKYTAAQIESFFDLLNSNSFITNTVSNLVNYYLKTELYTKTEIDTIVTNIKNSRFESVSVLPTENIKTNVIYLLPASNSKTNNIKDEYINLDGTTSGWENIGSTSVDLSNYVTLQALNNALANYVTSSDLTTALENFTPSKEGTDDYSELDNKPSIENVTLDGNKSASDLGLAKSSDLVNKQDKIQVTTIPEASIDLLNKVIQYIGATTQDYIHNYYYECISDGKSTPSYSWQQTNVQPSSGSGGSYTAGDGIDITDDTISIDPMPAEDMGDVIDELPTGGNIAVTGYVPLATIIQYYGETAPDFFLACDGATYNKADYPELAELLLGLTTHSQYEVDGDDTKFKVPDLRGEFLRMTGTNSHTDQGDGANVGVHQNATKQTNVTVYNSELYFIPDVGQQLSAPDFTTKGAKYQYLTNATKKGDGAYDAIFSARPTNTSVLFCIAYKDIYSNPMNDYSTDEKVVGTWINGDTLYQKTIVDTLPTTVNTTKYVSIDSLVDKIVFIEAIIESTEGIFQKLDTTNNGMQYVTKCFAISNDNNTANKNKIGLYTSFADRLGESVYITIQYTKA